MRRAWIVTAGIAVLIAMVGFYFWLYFLRDVSTRTDVAQALSDYRAQRYVSGTLKPKFRDRVPEPGVYRYQTTGSEHFDALVGSTHDFNGLSSITLTVTDCGVREHWRVLEERWSKAELCLGDRGARLQRLIEYHEFFGQSRQTEYTCHEDPVPFTRDLRVGMSWETRCRSDESRMRTRAKVEAVEQVTVKGTSYPALRISSKTTLTGDPAGTAERVSWMRRTDGLLLKRTSTSTARVRAAGGGQVDENFTLELISATPQS